MADFNNLSLTANGFKALLAAQAGETLTLTKIGMGSGSTTDSIIGLKNMVTPEVMMSISEKKIDEEAKLMTIVAKMTNEDITEGFYWREIGLFFEDSEGNTVLFAYSCIVDNHYDYVPAYSDKRYVKHVRIANIITDSANITVKEGEGLLYVDILTYEEFLEEYGKHVKEFEEHISNKSNPHGVTAEQIGLDKVENLSINDQKPTYTTATSLVTLTSGEKLSTAFGKIAKALKEFISHISNKSNPHGVTAVQVGALTSGDVVDNLLSTSTKLPLSGNQGKVLNEAIAKCMAFLPANASKKLITNAYLISTEERYGENNEAGFVVSGSTTNIPTNCWFGFREVYFYNSNYIVAKITGIPTSQDTVCEWSSYYNGTTWSGWKNASYGNRNIGDSSVDDLINDSFQGRYWITPSSVSGTHPFKGYYNLLVFPNVQLAFPYGRNCFKFRTYVNSAWTDWFGGPEDVTFTPVTGGSSTINDVFYSNGVVFFSITTNVGENLNAGSSSQIGTLSVAAKENVKFPCVVDNGNSMDLGMIEIETTGKVMFRPTAFYNIQTNITFTGQYRCK